MGMDRRSWVLKNYADGPSEKKKRALKFLNYLQAAARKKNLRFLSKKLAAASATSAAPGLKSPFLELWEDYSTIKSGFLPRSGCL